MKRNLEALIVNTKIIYCSNLYFQYDEELDYLHKPFEIPKTLYNNDENGINTMIIRADDFINIVTRWHDELLPDSIHILFDQLKEINKNNDIWIGLG